MHRAPACLSVLAGLAFLSLAAAPAQAATLLPSGAQEDGNSWLFVLLDSLHAQVDGTQEDGHTWLVAAIDALSARGSVVVTQA
jgi:hypothetical protein